MKSYKGQLVCQHLENIPHAEGGGLGWKIRKSIDCDIIEYRNKSERVV